jgi:hypothetical protein
MSKIMECRLPEQPDKTTRAEYQGIADSCTLKNKEKCKKDPIYDYEFCLMKPLSKFASRKNALRWIKYNPSAFGGGVYTKNNIDERSKRLVKELNPKEMELIINDQVCPYRGGYLDTRDVTYFIKKYKSDKKHRIFFPDPSLQKKIEEDDICIFWDSMKEDGLKGSLRFPKQLRGALNEFKGEWMIILMIQESGVHDDAHSNFLVYYPENRMITRVEAHGYNFSYYDQKNMDKRLKSAFHRYGINYLPPIETNIKQGPAHLTNTEMVKLGLKDLESDPGGFCMTWSYFLMHYMFQNPTLAPGKAMKQFVDFIWNSNYLFVDVLRNFHSMIKQSTEDFFKKYTKKVPKNERQYDELFHEHYAQIYKEYNNQ